MKLLLVTSSPISQKSSAWLVLKKIILKLQFNNLIIISLSPYYSARDKIDHVETRIWWTIFRYPILYKILKRISVSLLNQLYNDSAYKNSKKIVRIIKDEKIDKIWIHCDVLTIKSFNLILQKQSFKYHLTIFDDPLNDSNLENFGQALKENFIYLLNHATSLDVPAQELLEQYCEHGYIKNSQLSAISLSGTFKKKSPFPVVLRDNVKKICITGNIYGMEAFYTFCKAIMATCLAENIQFHIYSNADFIYKLKFKKNYKDIFNIVTFKPFIQEPLILKTLSDYDLLYLSYSFEESDYIKSMTSFPSKLHNYLASTVPIIVHAPDYSSIYKFTIHNGTGFIINSLDEKVIREEFKNICQLSNRLEVHKQMNKFIQTASENHHIDKIKEVILA